MTTNSTGSSSPLTATYTSPTSTKAFTYSLPDLSSPLSTEQKTAYLSTLRSYVQNMQDDINVFLTKKMEEDKAATDGVNGVNGEKVDEQREEENYGEEVVDE